MGRGERRWREVGGGGVSWEGRGSGESVGSGEGWGEK